MEEGEEDYWRLEGGAESGNRNRDGVEDHWSGMPRMQEAERLEIREVNEGNV